MTEELKTNALTTKAGNPVEISAGGHLAGIAPQSIDEAFRLSQALAGSGDMVPKHFQNQPQMIMAAIMRGAEVGLMPMQALSNIAVINGRASLWGDALPALIQRAGHQLDCVVEGEGDNRKAVATLMRGDTGQKIVREFSVDDAKRAGLWQTEARVTRKSQSGGSYEKENDSPWWRYPNRMLQMRARSWAVRDGAADALMGLQVAEEAEDMPPMRDVTPKPSRLAEIAAEVRAKQPGSALERAENADEPVSEGEDSQEDRFAALDASGAFPGSGAWARGESDAKEGKPETDCPYDAEADIIDYLGGHRGQVKAMSDG